MISIDIPLSIGKSHCFQVTVPTIITGSSPSYDQLLLARPPPGERSSTPR